MFTDKAVMITGGTGSFGKTFAGTVLKDYPGIKRLVIYSRDELKQFEMRQLYPESVYPQMRFFIGDVRDKERLFRAMEGINIVVHAAALKQVPACEYNPFEAVKTNVLGAQNVIECAIDRNIERVVALSTDKAAAPINLYGATKLCSDKLFVSANHFKGKRDIKFSVVRYGNVMGSRGSVIPFFLKKRKEKVLPITHTEMTRFNITLDQGVELVLFALENMWGGEIYIPKIPSYRILDVAEAVAPGCRYKAIGVRPGEKIHEQMVTETDSLNTLEFNNYYVILPSMPYWDIEAYLQRFNGSRCEPGFSYCSGTNTEWLSVEQIRELIKEHIDPDFRIEDTPSVREGGHRLKIRSSTLKAEKAFAGE
jgi:UDP-N-acetylglucosamine 4,6-dehydratase